MGGLGGKVAYIVSGRGEWLYASTAEIFLSIENLPPLLPTDEADIRLLLMLFVVPLDYLRLVEFSSPSALRVVVTPSDSMATSRSLSAISSSTLPKFLSRSLSCCEMMTLTPSFSSLLRNSSYILLSLCSFFLCS